ncbi:phytoene desaturase family protein [Egicoccus halophilus]|uniref:Pyridine nucleotide-disulfide oxidoreductase domain-containing protein 2 n=1 Tax=Egicoccus halophilus TaxID=1670830 RepID=A0A8J3A8X1_9ACTN|nr:NAD(P)/FAD-dependent oxidoreductase [Egicoccus halophilus]GGI06929.1 FAD-dependent oxidoreductase [Egicoccus halophilus]
MTRHDAIVIGAGPNGLAAAITLARAGRDVVLCEAADAPGGAVRTQELTLPGFLHDTFSSVYPAGAASPVFARWPLEDFGLEWVHPAVSMAHPFPDGGAVALHQSLERTAASLDASHAGDGAAWEQFAGPLLEVFPQLRRTMIGGWFPVVGPAGLLARHGMQGTLEFARLLLASARTFSTELFAGPRAQAWLAGSCLHGDVAADDAGSAITGTYLQLLGHFVGWPSPRGGAQRLADALAGYLESLGGTLRVNSRVTKVITAGGRTAGVELANGERLRANVVVADLLPGGLLSVAGDALGSAYRARLERYRLGPATVKVDWALDDVVPWTADEARGAGTVHVGGHLEDLVDAQRTVGAGRLPERPFLLFGQQSVADPSRAPEGKHTAWAYTRVPQSHRFDADGVTAFAERIDAQIERFAPGFRDRVLARHVMGPTDLEERNANLPGGDVGGGSYAIDQLIFRPVPGVSPYRTTVEGLYLGSAATFPGGAVHGACGHAAARVALTEGRVRRWL